MPTLAEDRDEILQLVYRYNHAVDSGDAQGWADTFTEDAVFEVGPTVVTGRQGLVDFASAMSSGMRHVTANPVIEITGDAASLRAYIFVFRGKEVGVTGTYEDQLVRTPGGWRFAKRVFSPNE
jgi:uncharacterized protein (TIGR02246 family)